MILSISSENIVFFTLKSAPLFKGKDGVGHASGGFVFKMMVLSCR